MKQRKPSNLSDPIHHQLNMYAVAAGAGVGMLALAVPAAGRIVYTPAHEQVPPGFPGYLDLDLNRDGINDVLFSNFFSSTSSTLNLTVSPVNPSNEIFSFTPGSAAALRAGVKVGPRGKFQRALGEGMAAGNSHGSCSGRWVHAHNRYLGLKFVIKGKTHFGWARLDVSCIFPKAINATLTGYAYETVPNKPIIAGKTHGKDAITLQDASLGHLARGASAIPAWR